MVESLEEYTKRATAAYQPAIDSINNSINGLAGQEEEARNRALKSYAQQRAQLDTDKNNAATAASVNAAATGASYSGAANLANRRYYNQSFVPAVTQLNTNQSNELSSIGSDYAQRRDSYNNQLASLLAQANRDAQTQYYNDANLEKQLAVQRAQIAAQNAWQKYVMDAQKQQQQGNSYKTWDFGNGYTLSDVNGKAIYYKNGTPVSAGDFLEGTRGTTNWNLWNDIWNNNHVDTTGVGSDTVDAYYKANPAGMNSQDMINFKNRWGYLY